MPLRVTRKPTFAVPAGRVTCACSQSSSLDLRRPVARSGTWSARRPGTGQGSPTPGSQLHGGRRAFWAEHARLLCSCPTPDHPGVGQIGVERIHLPGQTWHGSNAAPSVLSHWNTAPPALHRRTMLRGKGKHECLKKENTHTQVLHRRIPHPLPYVVPYPPSLYWGPVLPWRP